MEKFRKVKYGYKLFKCV